jgi:hypothetical protein
VAGKSIPLGTKGAGPSVHIGCFIPIRNWSLRDYQNGMTDMEISPQTVNHLSEIKL